MLNQKEILSTIDMIDQQHSGHPHHHHGHLPAGLLRSGCRDAACDKIYEKITRYAEKLVKTGEDIEQEFGIPIVNKRISVTPMALVAGASETEDYVPFAMALDRAAKTCGVNFIGGYSALVQKGMTACGRAADPLHPGGPGRDGAGVLLRQRGLHQGGHQYGCGGAHGPHHQGYRRAGRRTGTAWAAPSWWCSATPWRTTPSWPAPSTAWARRNASSTWAFPAPAWCITPCRR